MHTDFIRSLNENIELKKKLPSLEKKVHIAINIITECLKKKNKLLICGNGGSAADAQHLAAEYLVRLKPTLKRKPFPVINLAQDQSTITACGNDLGFEQIFARNLEAFYKKGDVLIIISTSGNSKNIINALKFAKKKKIITIGLLGNNGGKSKKFCKCSIIVPDKNTARIQECHIFLGHFIFEQVESLLLRND